MYDLKQFAKRCFISVAIFLIIVPYAVATDLGVSIRIGQPGFYGEIHLGDYYPAPDLIYPEPVIIQRPSVYVGQQPIYLHVPPGHAKLWHRYCYHYNACNQPVYFIRENWYNNVYIPHYHQHDNHQHRHYESYPRNQYDPGRHYYQDRQYDSHRHYDDDHKYRDKYRRKDKDHRYGYDKHNHYDKHDKHGNDKHGRGRGKKHDH